MQRRNDLLHQLSNTTYEVNAQGRTETWYRVIPNYVMLRVAWQFNKNPKKKYPHKTFINMKKILVTMMVLALTIGAQAQQYDSINTYTYDYTLCGRTTMLRATFKL